MPEKYYGNLLLFFTSRTVLDKQTGQDVRLSDADLDIVHRVMSHRVPDGSYDMYAPWVDHFTHEVMEMPLSGRPESKKSFIPSKVTVWLFSVICFKTWPEQLCRNGWPSNLLMKMICVNGCLCGRGTEYLPRLGHPVCRGGLWLSSIDRWIFQLFDCTWNRAQQ